MAGKARLGNQMFVLDAIAEKLTVKGVAAGAGKGHNRLGLPMPASPLPDTMSLNCVSLLPTGWESKPISIDKADKLPVMLDFMFQKIESKVNLRVCKIREVDFIQPLMG